MSQVRLSEFNLIMVNSSAGKDSQAMLDLVVEQARKESVLDRIQVAHCDLNRAEWPGTKELAEEHAKHYGLPFWALQRKKLPFLLDEIRTRGMWPSNTERYCTSYYKREPVQKLVTQLHRAFGRQRRLRVLNCLGFRAEESTARRKRKPFALNKRYSTKGSKNFGQRETFDWLPIHQWSEQQVWDRIEAAGTRPHPAYALGMPRLSCIV